MHIYTHIHKHTFTNAQLQILFTHTHTHANIHADNTYVHVNKYIHLPVHTYRDIQIHEHKENFQAKIFSQ